MIVEVSFRLAVSSLSAIVALASRLPCSFSANKVSHQLSSDFQSFFLFSQTGHSQQLSPFALTSTNDTYMKRYLSWNLHPPTASCFSKHLVLLLPVSNDERSHVLEATKFLIELSVIDYFFVPHRPSTVALSALLNALDMVPRSSNGTVSDLIQELRNVPGLDPNSLEVKACRERLDLVYAHGGYSSPVETCAEEEIRTTTVSPDCVSYGVRPQDEQHRGKRARAADNDSENPIGDDRIPV